MQHTCALESFNVLGPLGKFCDGLDEGDSCLLIGFKGSEDSS